MNVGSVRCVICWLSLFGAAMIGTLYARDIEQLEILQDRYPRAFFFRAAEQAWSARQYPTYESWDEQFSRLQGVIGKCLDEECLGREARNPAFFSRFKREHPTQVVLLHFNGNARDPRYHTTKYFPGHWIDRRAAIITGDVPAQTGETVIHVADPSTFRIKSVRLDSGTTGDYRVRMFSREQKTQFEESAAESREKREEYSRRRRELIGQIREQNESQGREELRMEVDRLEQEYEAALRSSLPSDVLAGEFYEIIEMGRDYVGFRKDDVDLFLRISSIQQIRRVVESNGNSRQLDSE